MTDKLSLTPKEITSIRKDTALSGYAGDLGAIDFAERVGLKVAKAQLTKVQPEIDMLKEESEARREIIRRLTNRCEELQEALKHRLDRPELRKKIEEIVTPVVKNYVLGYIHNLSQLEVELKKQVDYITDQLVALYPEEEEIRKQERERILAWRYEPCPHNEAYEKGECDACWQALKEGE